MADLLALKRKNAHEIDAAAITRAAISLQEKALSRERRLIEAALTDGDAYSPTPLPGIAGAIVLGALLWGACKKP